VAAWSWLPRGCIVNAWIERLIRLGVRLVDRLRAVCNVTAQGAAIQKKNPVATERRVHMAGNGGHRHDQENVVDVRSKLKCASRRYKTLRPICSFNVEPAVRLTLNYPEIGSFNFELSCRRAGVGRCPNR
jgi:hypothetical protein